MRLRPGGSSGMIVSHIDAFEDYLKTQAWTWEHQALIRARPVVGDKNICSAFNKIREEILTQKRDIPVLKKEVGEMRERMRQERLNIKKESFDLKQSKGGIVDIEFLVQYLVLKNANIFPDITIWTDNIRLLESLDAEGIITGKTSELLQNAWLLMRKSIHHLNLQEKSIKVYRKDFIDISQNVKKIYDHYLKISS